MHILARMVICAGLYLLTLISAGSALAIEGEVKFITEDLPPFNYLNDQRVPSGPARAIVDEICQRLQVKCSHRLLPVKRRVREAEKGHAHGIYSLGKNTSRMSWLYFSKPIIRTEYGYFVNRNDPVRVNGLSDLNGYTLVTLTASNMLNTLKKEIDQEGEKDVEIVVRPTMQSALKMLEKGRFGEKSAAFSNRDVGLTIIKNEKLNNLRYAGIHSQLLYHIAFIKKTTDQAFVEKFNRELTRIYDSGTLAKIVSSFGLQVPKPEDMKPGLE